MCFKQVGAISTVNGEHLKSVEKFTHLGSGVSSTESGVDTRIAKKSTAIDRLSVIWKPRQTDKIKRDFFQSTGVPIQLCGCTA